MRISFRTSPTAGSLGANRCSIEKKWGLRHSISLMGFFAIGITYIHTFCLSLAITEMVTSDSKSNKIDEESCPFGQNTTTIIEHAGEFDWNEETQGLILSSFFWSYIISYLPGGLMSVWWGVKRVIGFSMIASTIGTLLTPVVSRTSGSWGLVCLRIFMGFAQGPLYPAVNELMSNWYSANERRRVGAVVYGGAFFGNFSSMAISGLIISNLGWTGVFYIFGGIGILWSIIWMNVYYNSPLEHPFIDENEKTYIITTSGKTHCKDLPPTPWIPIFTSVPLWGAIIAQFGHDWGLLTIITDLPKYMKSILHVLVEENGVISGLPYLGMCFFSVLSGVVMDWMIIKLGWDITRVKKIFLSIASVGPAVGIIAASYSGCDKVSTSLFFILAVTIMGAYLPSIKVNALDLSPNYAGTLMAIVGGLGAMPGILTPYLVGKLTPQGTLREWRLIFWIAVAMLIGTNIIYLMMGTAKTQWWNDPDRVRSYREGKVVNKEETA